MALPAFSHGVSGDQPYSNGSIPVGLFCVSQAAGSALASSVVATNVEGALNGLAGGSAFATTVGTIPAGHLNSLGKAFRFKAAGIIGNTGTPNLTIAFLLGTTVVATTGVQAMATITTTKAWDAECYGVVTAIGASGTVMTAGRFNYNTTAVLAPSWGIGNTTLGTADTVDLTAAQAVHVQATWGTSSASNTLTCTYFSFEFLN